MCHDGFGRGAPLRSGEGKGNRCSIHPVPLGWGTGRPVGSSMRDADSSLRWDTVRSLAVHGAGAVVVLALGTWAWVDREGSETAAVEPAQVEAIADATSDRAEVATEPAAPTDAPAGPEQQTPAPPPPPTPEQALAQASLAAQLEQAVVGEVAPEDQAALLEAARQMLREQTQEVGTADVAAAIAGMRNEAFGGLRDRVREMAREALLAEVNRQLDAELFEQIKARLAAELQGKFGEELRKRLIAALKKEHEERIAALQATAKTARQSLEQAARQLDGAKQSATKPKPDEAQRKGEAAATALAESEAPLKTLVDAATSVPQVAQAAGELRSATASDLGAPMQAARTALEGQQRDEAARRFEEVRAATQARVEAVKRLEQALGQAKGKLAEDEVSQELLASALPGMEQRLSAELREAPIDAAAKAASEKLAAGLSERMREFGLADEEVRELVGERVREGLAERMREEQPAVEPGFTRVKQDMRLQTPEKLQAAEQALNVAATALDAARAAQQAVAIDDASKPGEALAAQQAGVSEAYAAAPQAIAAATEAARAASEKSQGKLDSVAKSVVAAEAPQRLERMPELLRAGARDAAKQSRDVLVRHWEQQASTLRAVAGELGQERAQLAAAPRAADTDAEPSAAAVQAFGEHAAAQVSEVAAARLPEALAGMGEVDVRGTQGLDDRLAELGTLYNKLGQLAENANDGRPASGLDALALGLGGLAGYGDGVGMFDPYHAQYNAEAIERYGEELRNRSSPQAYYADAAETAGLASTAQPIDGDTPALIVVPPTTVQAGPAQSDAAQRTVPTPTFKHVAFAAAPMMEKPVTIDGDLADWGELRHPIPTRFEDDGRPANDPTNVYFRWSPEGLFIAYTTKKAGPIAHNSATGWQGDCLEVWLDMENARVKQMEDSTTAHQFFLMPFGFQNDPSRTFAEYSRGTRGFRHSATYAHAADLGKAAAKAQPGVGYTVEAFISRRALSVPNLYPGAYLAMNYSLNRGWGSPDWQQWSAPKAQFTFNKPDTWGDLLLLGSDAAARFTDPRDPERDAEPAAPGQPLAVEVRDKDMDLNPRRKDLVPAMLRCGGSSLVMILEETSPDSGVFRGSANTQPIAAPAAPNTLGVRGGEPVELVYTDARAEYGETDRMVTARLEIGAPVMNLTGRAAAR